MEFEEDYSEAFYPEPCEEEIEDFNQEEDSIDPVEQNTQDIIYRKSKGYFSMDLNQAEKYMRELINDLIETWGVTESTALRLLKRFDWDPEEANRNVTENGNIDTSDFKNNSQEFDCGICYETIPIDNAYSFGCDHYYCQSCFASHIQLAINEGQPFKTCPHQGCPEILTPRLCFEYFGNNEEVYNKYKRFLLQTIVDSSPNLLWCPGTKCMNIIQLLKMKKSDKTLLNIRCPCGHCFCLTCRDVAHRPLQCEHFAKWKVDLGTKIEEKEDTLTTEWIQKNSKPCPRCLINIEKVHGCMHMTCRSCNFEFCWICMGDWSEHNEGSWKCNKEKRSTVVKKLRDEQNQIEKYSFYRERFGQHWNAVQYAIRKKRLILYNFRSIINYTEYPKDESFLTEILDLIIDARRAISMTYAAGDYRKSVGLETDLFEEQQSLLWKVLDQLDKFTDPLEKDQEMKDLFVDYISGRVFLDDKFYAFKEKLNQKAEAVSVACNVLLKAMEEDNKKLSFIEEKEEEDIKITNLEIEIENDVDEDSWHCALCTFKNKKISTTCGACENMKFVFGHDVNFS